jgi:hypothetical protein
MTKKNEGNSRLAQRAACGSDEEWPLGSSASHGRQEIQPLPPLTQNSAPKEV